MFSWFAAQALWAQFIIGFIAIAVLIAAVWALLSLVLLPVIALIQHALEPSENTTSMSEADYLWGTLTLGVDLTHTGEVMVTGGGEARQVYPAKLYESETAALSKGTQVVIIEVTHGTAFVKRLVTPSSPQ